MAIRVGVSLLDYEYMTPHELNLHIQVYIEQQRLESNNNLLYAYMGAVWQRVNKLEPWKSIQNKLDKPLYKQKKKQTNEEMLEIAKLWDSHMRGKN